MVIGGGWLCWLSLFPNLSIIMQFIQDFNGYDDHTVHLDGPLQGGVHQDVPLPPNSGGDNDDGSGGFWGDLARGLGTVVLGAAQGLAQAMRTPGFTSANQQVVGLGDLPVDPIGDLPELGGKHYPPTLCPIWSMIFGWRVTLLLPSCHHQPHSPFRAVV